MKCEQPWETEAATVLHIFIYVEVRQSMKYGKFI